MSFCSNLLLRWEGGCDNPPRVKTALKHLSCGHWVPHEFLRVRTLVGKLHRSGETKLPKTRSLKSSTQEEWGQMKRRELQRLAQLNIWGDSAPGGLNFVSCPLSSLLLLTARRKVGCQEFLDQKQDPSLLHGWWEEFSLSLTLPLTFC